MGESSVESVGCKPESSEHGYTGRTRCEWVALCLSSHVQRIAEPGFQLCEQSVRIDSDIFYLAFYLFSRPCAHKMSSDNDSLVFFNG